MGAYDYSTLAEELASAGYIVVGINSPRHSRFFRPDGTYVAADQSWAPPGVEIYSPFERADRFFELSNATISQDFALVVDRLAELNRSDSVLAGRFDFERMALAGHSNGAMAGARACDHIIECRAFLGIEGTQAREIRQRGVSKPYGLIISEQSLSYDQDNVYLEMGSHSPTLYEVYRVAGASHNFFTDFVYTRPNFFENPVEPEGTVGMTRTLVRDFMDRHLKGLPAVGEVPGVSKENFSGS